MWIDVQLNVRCCSVPQAKVSTGSASHQLRSTTVGRPFAKKRRRQKRPSRLRSSGLDRWIYTDTDTDTYGKM